jgi:hypothetical protein
MDFMNYVLIGIGVIGVVFIAVMIKVLDRIIQLPVDNASRISVLESKLADKISGFEDSINRIETSIQEVKDSQKETNEKVYEMLRQVYVRQGENNANK